MAELTKAVDWAVDAVAAAAGAGFPLAGVTNPRGKSDCPRPRLREVAALFACPRTADIAAQEMGGERAKED